MPLSALGYDELPASLGDWLVKIDELVEEVEHERMRPKP